MCESVNGKKKEIIGKKKPFVVSPSMALLSLVQRVRPKGPRP